MDSTYTYSANGIWQFDPGAAIPTAHDLKLPSLLDSQEQLPMQDGEVENKHDPLFESFQRKRQSREINMTMAEEKLKIKSLKLKDSRNIGKSEFLKCALKRPSTKSPYKSEKGNLEKNDKENSNKNDKSFLKGKEALKSSSKDSVRSSIGSKIVVKVGKELAKDNIKVQEEKVANKFGSLVMKQETRILVKDNAKSPVKLLSKEEKVSIKDAEKVDEEEQGNNVGKVLSKVNGKDFGRGRDLIKVNDEDMDHKREREKGKSHVEKSVLKTLVKQGNATKIILKSTNAGASSSLGLSLKKKVMQTKTIAISKIVTKLKKEKKLYYLPGQKHAPPEDKDPLRIFYSTLRDQMPGSDMAKIWLMEYGLLPHDEIMKGLLQKQRRRQFLKHGTSKKTSSTPLQSSNGSLEVKKATLISSGKGKDVRTSSKGKHKRDNSESDSDHDFLQKAQTKKKLKA